MKKSTRALMLVTGMTVSVTAIAGGNTPSLYVGGGYTDATVDFSDLHKSADTGVLFARAGYQLNENIAFEARLGSGVDDGHIYNAKVEVEDLYGVYLKAGIPLQMGFYPYALLGATHGKVKVSGGGFSETDTSSDISYGIGIDYWFNRKISAGLEYANFYDKDGVEVSGWTLGANYKF